MIIKKISINNFGKLSDVNIFPEYGLNVIYGANESGKTTLLSFIRYIFYGTKQKKDHNDLTFKERFMPWNTMQISGSCEIEYEGFNYSIQRIDGDGYTKLTVINLDKGIEEKSITNPGQHFLKVGEKTFDSLLYLRDLSLVSGFSDGGELISFLTNSPVEKNTYQKVKHELNERLANINSTKRKNSLLSNIESQIESSNNKLLQLQSKLNDVEDKVSCIAQIEEQIVAVNKELDNLYKEKNINLLNEVKDEKVNLIKEKNIIEKQIQQTSLNETLSEEDKQLLVDDFNEYMCDISKNRKSIIKFLLVFSLFFVFGVTFAFFLFKINYLFLLPSCFVFVCSLFFIKKATNKIKSNKYIVKNLTAKKKLQQQLMNSLNLNSRSECLLYVSSANGNISTSQLEYMQERLSDINKKLDLYNKLPDSLESFVEIISLNTNCFTNSKLDDIIKNRIIELQNLTEKLNKLVHYKSEVYVLKNDIASINNELKSLYFEKERLAKEADIIACSIQILEDSFAIAKKTFFPDLANHTLHIFNYISNEDYKSLNFDENFNVMFNKDSFFRTSKFLSSGACDILYLSLKAAIIQMISQSDSFLPILIDDIFANCDDDRAERLMNMILNLSKNHQIFLSTCRNRELLFLKNKNNVNIIDI